MKKILQSKTVWLSILTAIAGVMTVILGENPQLNTVGWITIVKAVIDFGLRMITSKPVSPVTL